MSLSRTYPRTYSPASAVGPLWPRLPAWPWPVTGLCCPPIPQAQHTSSGGGRVPAGQLSRCAQVASGTCHSHQSPLTCAGSRRWAAQAQRCLTLDSPGCACLKGALALGPVRFLLSLSTPTNPGQVAGDLAEPMSSWE